MSDRKTKKTSEVVKEPASKKSKKNNELPSRWAPTAETITTADVTTTVAQIKTLIERVITRLDAIQDFIEKVQVIDGPDELEEWQPDME